MRITALVCSLVLLSGCAETFLSRAELEAREQRKAEIEKNPQAPLWNNTDPRLGKVELDHHCGFWSCKDTHMQCVGLNLIITAPNATPVRVTDAEECKP